ncbi:MAG: GTP-binding protein [Candidatus Heimdallarchaeaceae archaeon]
MSKYLKTISTAMYYKDKIRNISIVSHVDHGKTTLSDHLLQGGGLISENMAGSARVLDYLDEEQRRGITIKTANISFLYNYNELPFLINLVDTPGHVDFSGMVSQALRLVDGVVIVIDAVEQIMAQTESVIIQAMNECLKPILFINKIDRLINELKFSQKEIELRLKNIIEMTNELIERYAFKPFKNKWKVRFDNGTVILGSALHGWGISKYSKKLPQFDQIIELYKKNALNKLKNDFPIVEAIMGSIIECIPNPKRSQSQKIGFITQYIDDKSRKSIEDCSDEENAILCVGKLLYDRNRGIISVTRVFSGEVKAGAMLQNKRTKKTIKIHQVCVYKGESLIAVNKVGAGNIAALIGLKDVQIGDTFIEDGEQPQNVLFKQIPYLQEPVISRRIEPCKISDIPKLKNILEIMSLIKPNFHFNIDENTGEIKIQGIGELQLEISVGEIKELGIEVEVKDPEVTFVEQIEKEVLLEKENHLELIALTAVCKKTEQKDKRCIFSDYRENCLCVNPKKISDEIGDLIKIGFRNAINRGPLFGYPIRKLTVEIDEITELSPNSLRYEIIVPSIKNLLHKALLRAGIDSYEPFYSFSINTPTHYLGSVLSIAQKFGCKIENTEQYSSRTIIYGEISVESSIKIASELRAASEGYAFWQFRFQGYKRKS